MKKIIVNLDDMLCFCPNMVDEDCMDGRKPNKYITLTKFLEKFHNTVPFMDPDEMPFFKICLNNELNLDKKIYARFKHINIIDMDLFLFCNQSK